METLDGRVALVTGANRGIGLEIAGQLARRGLRVVLGSRDRRSGEAAADLGGSSASAASTSWSTMPASSSTRARPQPA